MPTDAQSELLHGLRGIVGDAHVLARTRPDSTELAAWENDWRKRTQGHALAVVQPANTREVAAAVGLCATLQARTGVRIVPQGGNTGLVVGSTPDASGRPAPDRSLQERCRSARR